MINGDNIMSEIKVSVDYKPLWKILIDKEKTKAQLRAETGIAASTFTKMNNNQMVSLEVVARIALALDCGIDDIVEIHKF